MITLFRKIILWAVPRNMVERNVIRRLHGESPFLKKKVGTLLKEIIRSGARRRNYRRNSSIPENYPHPSASGKKTVRSSMPCGQWRYWWIPALVSPRQ